MKRLGYLLERMELRGVKPRALLAGTGIQVADVRRADFKPSATAYRALLRNIVDLSLPGIGIALGLETTIADEGVLGYAALSSATLRDVNELIKTYASIIEDFTVYADSVINGDWVIEFDTVYPMGDMLPVVIEELFGRTKADFKIYTGVDIPFKTMDLAYPEPPYADLYRTAFRCPVRFNQDRNRVAVDASYLELPVVYSNPEVRRLLEAQCAKLLGVNNGSTNLGESIRRRLILAPGKYPLLPEMSAAMGLSPTTLKRRLSEEGETYQGILDGIRKDLAIQYLEETRLSPKEISFRLGYSNVHNFRRAFKAWTGRNPSHFQGSR